MTNNLPARRRLQSALNDAESIVEGLVECGAFEDPESLDTDLDEFLTDLEIALDRVANQLVKLWNTEKRSPTTAAALVKILFEQAKENRFERKAADLFAQLIESLGTGSSFTHERYGVELDTLSPEEVKFVLDALAQAGEDAAHD